MQRITSIVALLVLFSGALLAQQSDSTVATKPAESPKQQRVFYGGTLGLSFGNTFRISIEPFVGYVFTPQLSGGVKLRYEYVRQTNNGITTTWNNYGASVFGRYRFVPRAYFMAEFAYMSYGYTVYEFTSERTWVPFLMLGGGYIQPISPTTSLFVEVLFDVLQDSNSPYDAWTPFVSVGVSVGL
jgi:hypothetical protein